MAIALTGQRALPFWSGSERDAKFDASDLKGVLEEFFEQFGLRGMTFARQAESTALFLESAVILLGKQSSSANSASCCPRWRRNMICATPCCWRN